MGSLAEERRAVGLAELLCREGTTLQFPQADVGPYALQRIKTSQCQVACPLGTDVKGYVGLIAAGKFQKSLDLIRETNPFPAICGRVCLHPCEPECQRGDVDAPVAIRTLKRFVAEWERQHPFGTAPDSPVLAKAGPKVAVIGSGPAGLTAANDLARWGFRVTVFEALPVAGGMLTAGIPPFRLPRDVIEAEISAIAAQGVEIRTKKRIGNPSRLLRQGYRAVFLATGAHRGLKMGLPGEELPGCIDALSFLREVHLQNGRRPGQRVIVIGAGFAALDAARTARRLGSSQVDLIYRRSREELPYPDLAAEAGQEGVKIHYHLEPVRVLSRAGKVHGLACRKLRSGPPDRSGRRQPLPIEGSRVDLRADAIIFAIHQEPDLTFLPKQHGFEISRWNSLVVDPSTLATNQKGIFAGGDVVSGPKSVIEAMAMGHLGAAAIRRYLRGQEPDTVIADHTIRQSEVIIEDWVPQEKARLRIRRHSVPSWEGHLEEAVRNCSEKGAVSEAQRCLMCGPCDECDECIAACQKKLMAVSVPGSGDGEVLVRIPWILDRFPKGKGPWEVIIEDPAGNRFPALASPVVCDVWEQLCRGCAECVQVCQYEARRMVSRGDGLAISEVDATVCRGCGACATVCPTGASTIGHFTESHQVEDLRRLLASPAALKDREKATQPRLVAFACHWSAYRMLESGEVDVKVDLRSVRVMCLSSVHPGLVLRAFELGADGVLLLGCNPERCRYGSGIQVAENQLDIVYRLLATLGIERSRVRLGTISPGQGDQLARIIRRFARTVGRLGPSPLAR